MAAEYVRSTEYRIVLCRRLPLVGCLRVSQFRKGTTGLKWTRPRFLYPFWLNMFYILSLYGVCMILSFFFSDDLRLLVTGRLPIMLPILSTYSVTWPQPSGQVISSNPEICIINLLNIPQSFLYTLLKNKTCSFGAIERTPSTSTMMIMMMNHGKTLTD